MSELELFKKLAKPFPADVVKWRVGQTSNDDTACKPLAYITARHVMGRLDKVLGFNNWKDDLNMIGDAYRCELSVRVNDEWITKVDVAEGTNIETVKGGASDAFKRVAVKFGIGRYLYDIDDQWVDLKNIKKMDNSAVYAGYSDQRGINMGFYPPDLPSFAKPSGSNSNDVDENTPEPDGGDSSLDPRDNGTSELASKFVSLVDLLKPFEEFMDNIAMKHFEGQDALNEAQVSDKSVLKDALDKNLSKEELKKYVNALNKQKKEEQKKSQESDLIE